MARRGAGGAGDEAAGVVARVAREAFGDSADALAARNARRVARRNAASGSSRATRNAADDLPDGYHRDARGQVHGPDGHYASDPNAVPRDHSRDTEYPSGYRQSTHDDLAHRYTAEGRAQGQTPVDAHGNRIPREDLTWYDGKGRPIPDPAKNLTYEHRHPVVDHWNTEGHNQSRADRNDWYNDSQNMEPMHRKDNSAGGGAMTARYRQDTGPNYSST